MVTETGVIEQVEEDWAWVVTQRISVCAHLSSKKHRHIMKGGDSVVIKVRNFAGAVVGDKVELYISTAVKIKLIVLLYILPVIGLLIGASSTDSLSQVMNLNPILGILIFSMGGFTLTLKLVRIIFNHIASNTDLTPVTRRVLSKTANGTSSNIECFLNQGVGELWCVPGWVEKEVSCGKYSSMVRPGVS